MHVSCFRLIALYVGRLCLNSMKVYVISGEPKETTWMAIRFNMKAEAIVYERRRIKGCFLENLELDEFPFDTQV